MSPGTLMTDAAAWLADHRDRVLKEWASRLGAEVEGLAVFAAVDGQARLAKYMDEIMGMATGRRIEAPINLKTTLPQQSVRAEVSVLLLGEDAMGRVLRRHWRGSEEDGLRLRRKLSRLFHAAQRINSAGACDHCHHDLIERLQNTRALEKEMERGGTR